MAADNGYSYFGNVVLWLDQGLNVLFGGSCDETPSSRIHRLSKKKGGRWTTLEKVVNTIFFWDKDAQGRRHCELSTIAEIERRHDPKALLTWQI